MNTAEITEQLPAWFRETPTGRAFLAEQRAEIEEKRRIARAAIAAADEGFRAELPSLDEDLAQAQKRVETAQDLLERSRQILARAHAAKFEAANRRELAVRPQEKFLRETAPAAIAAFREELQREFENLRSQPGTETPGAKTTLQPSRTRRILAIASMWSALDRLALEVATDDEARERVEQLRASLPAIVAEPIESASEGR